VGVLAFRRVCDLLLCGGAGMLAGALCVLLARSRAVHLCEGGVPSHVQGGGGLMLYGSGSYTPEVKKFWIIGLK
jgi:hypothetical protein